MKTLAILLAFFFILKVNSADAQSFITSTGEIIFTSKASKLTFNGSSKQLQGLIDFDKSLVDFYLDLASLKTGNRLRDKHMRDNYLEVSKYPFAEFTGSITSPFDLQSKASQEVIVEGEFTIHGVTKSISVSGSLQKEGTNLLLNASWKVKLGDYNIGIPKLMFLELSETQDVSISATLSSQN